jgi:poly-gamma-glutamate synthesis protein (capsule biosynthesis protein)
MLLNIARTGFLVACLLSASKVSDSENIQDIKAPADKEVTVLFAGDIMQHGPQITAAWNDSLKEYDYSSCFQYVTDIVSGYDIAIANLELTLAGEPYTGYPQFSAPDELAVAVKNAGFDILATANNHSCDSGDKGIIRTAHVIDSLAIMRTGTFYDSTDYKSRHPLMIESNEITIALLNYTYGTNGLPFNYPAMVNLIDRDKIVADLAYCKSLNPDFIIIYYHWGNEYETQQNTHQEELARLSIENGADAVIGSHPHVIQPFVYTASTDSLGRNNLVVYSLGNFVSNQRDRNRDGGAMVGFKLSKTWNRTTLTDPVYHLTWVYTPTENNKRQYYILPINDPNINQEMSWEDQHKRAQFINDSRERLNNKPGSLPEAPFVSTDNLETPEP